MRTDSERTAVSEGTRHAGVQNERFHLCKIQRQAKLIHGAGGSVVVPVSPGPVIPIWVLVTRGRGGFALRNSPNHTPGVCVHAIPELKTDLKKF